MWAVAQLKPVIGSADLAITNLTRQGFESFNPTFNERRVIRNKVRFEPKQVFPGYLFVGIRDDQRWSPIRNTYGVATLLTRPSSTNEWLEPVPVDSFVAQLQGCCHRHDKASWVLPIGSQVRITSGPFALHEGTITGWSSAERCQLLLWVMGRDVQITISATDIIAV